MTKKAGNLEQVLGSTFKAVAPGEVAEPSPDDARADELERFIALDAREQIFDKTFDAEYLAASKLKAAPYKDLAGRADPFDYERMRQAVGTWSVLIERSVITYPDACDHAVQLTKLWLTEDRELEQIAARNQSKAAAEVAKETEVLVEGTKAYEVEQARIKWREAVAQRNKIKKEWDDYVDACRTYYRTLRDS